MAWPPWYPACRLNIRTAQSLMAPPTINAPLRKETAFVRISPTVRVFPTLPTCVHTIPQTCRYVLAKVQFSHFGWNDRLTRLHQCCVEIACSVPRAGSGYCRSIEKNGCSDGKFYAGFCPGDDDDDDIRCCVQGTNNSSSSSSSPPPLSPPQPQLQPEPRSPCSKTAFNNLMYKESISAFLKSKSAKSPSCFDWSDDGCSWSSEMPSGYYYFSPSCKRHDFGSRNAKKYNWFNEEVKEKIDSQFKDDLYDVCREFSGWESTKGVECRRTADWYLWFVRTFGTKTKRERET